MVSSNLQSACTIIKLDLKFSHSTGLFSGRDVHPQASARDDDVCFTNSTRHQERIHFQFLLYLILRLDFAVM